jgi:hypothetical protein
MREGHADRVPLSRDLPQIFLIRRFVRESGFWFNFHADYADFMDYADLFKSPALCLNKIPD